MRILIAAMLSAAFVMPAFAQEKEDVKEDFSRVSGASVYDYKEGIDGALVSEEYLLTHVTCTDGSKTLRVLLPIGLDDVNADQSGDGPKNTLKKKGAGYTADFKADAQVFHKDLALKPVKDPKSHYHQQFEITVDVGDALYKGMRAKDAVHATALIGNGGINLELPVTAKFSAFLKSCGLKAE